MKDLKYILVLPFFAACLISIFTISTFYTKVLLDVGLHEKPSLFVFLLSILFWSVLHYHLVKILAFHYFKEE